METLQTPNLRLSVVCDVVSFIQEHSIFHILIKQQSCDTTNPNNPIPIYDKNSTFDNPTIPLSLSNPPLSVISIDHLPSLLPAESSEAFSNDLLPYMVEIKNRADHPVWQRAEKLFREKVSTLPAELRKREI